MEHNNLLFYLSENELRTDHPEGKITSVRPGIAFSQENRIVLFNRKKTQYTITLRHEDRSGHTLATATSAVTSEVLENRNAKVTVYSQEINNCKPIKKVEKIVVSGNCEHTFLYLIMTAYTVTVHHMSAGSALTADTTVISPLVFEEEFADIKIVPLSIEGYRAETATIRVSGNTEYTVEYVELPDYPYVDMGLPSGTLWGEYNIGATSPEEFGYYFAWGETEPKTSYVINNYAWYDVGAGNFTKYTSSNMILEPGDDAATVNAGGDFHVPTTSQVEELLQNCQSAITTYNSVPGVLLTSSNNGNTLFFPGSKVVGENMSDVTGNVDITSAFTWTSVSYGDGEAKIFDLYNSGWETYHSAVYYGIPVRGVIGTIAAE